jgi:hypothetical protein
MVIKNYKWKWLTFFYLTFKLVKVKMSENKFSMRWEYLLFKRIYKNFKIPGEFKYLYV